MVVARIPRRLLDEIGRVHASDERALADALPRVAAAIRIGPTRCRPPPLVAEILGP